MPEPPAAGFQQDPYETPACAGDTDI